MSTSTVLPRPDHDQGDAASGPGASGVPSPSGDQPAAALQPPIAEMPDFKNMPIEEVENYLRSEGIDPEEEREYGRKVIERIRAKMAGEKPWHPSCPRYPSDGPCNCG